MGFVSSSLIALEYASQASQNLSSLINSLPRFLYSSALALSSSESCEFATYKEKKLNK